jgi:hypothetical protein
MEFWLIDSNNDVKIRLPVPPPEFTVEIGQDVHVVNVNEFGEYSIKGDSKLDRISFKTFFPDHEYPFVQHRGFRKPYDNIKIIEAWTHNKLPCRLMITSTNINKLFFIDSFSYGERAGSRDVEFEISLIEYKPIVVPKDVKASTNKNPRPPAQKTKPKTYTVKKGDTLWNISRVIYKDPYQWTDIAKKNGIKDPKKLPIGKVLVLP